jgi:hypothetical protein
MADSFMSYKKLNKLRFRQAYLRWLILDYEDRTGYQTPDFGHWSRDDKRFAEVAIRLHCKQQADDNAEVIDRVDANRRHAAMVKTLQDDTMRRSPFPSVAYDKSKAALAQVATQHHDLSSDDEIVLISLGFLLSVADQLAIDGHGAAPTA